MLSLAKGKASIGYTYVAKYNFIYYQKVGELAN